ncbi:YfjI family protein [uncultured Thiothrix sp.]|uniref:YfjI family protein n=1 Tax=uncultured Thiothrix sp. TaxID=223185 RepID=UPI00260C9FDD|nr:YfjI family protein [uncultured Thiothrix sp.]HMT94917.1 YfjI family protein [Thiolinea sp.]
MTTTLMSAKPALALVNNYVRTEQPTAGAWETPDSLTGQSQSASYPDRALPGLVGEAIREVVNIVKCPTALAANAALSVLATAGQGVANIQAHQKLKPSPLSLYLLSIGESGERKTTADRYFSEVLDQWAFNKQEELKPGLIKARARISAWEKECEGIRDAIKQAGRKGEDIHLLTEKLIIAEQSKPSMVYTPKMIFADATPEAIGHDLAHRWPSAGILSGEAGIVFGGYGMKADNITRNLAFLNVAWEGGSIPIARRGEGGSYDLRDVRLSMGLAVQPAVIHDFYEKNGELARGSGFAARFLLAWPTSTQGTRYLSHEELTSDTPTNALHCFYGRLHEVLEQQYQRGQLGTLKELPTLQLSALALELWREYFNSVEYELRTGGDMQDYKDIASKSADNAARLAGLFHLFEGCSVYDTIHPDIMEAAITLAAWHLYEARRFFGEIAVPTDLSNAIRLDAWLLDYCKTNHTSRLGRRDIQRFAPNRVRNGSDLDKALYELEAANRIRQISEGRKVHIQINPALLGG